MKKIIAIPTEHGTLCPHFGHCQEFAIISTVEGKITDISYKTPPSHVPGLYPEWVAGQNVSIVIAGGMGQKAIDLFNAKKIDVYLGAPLKPPIEITEDFLRNKLKLNANYCDSETKGHGHCK